MGDNSKGILLKNLIYLVWYIAFIITVIILTEKTLTSVLDFSQEYDLALANWENKAILDIKVIDTVDSCPSGYDSNVFNYKWQGTVDGCECSDVLFKGKCSKIRCKDNGKEVDRSPPIDFKNYQFNGVVSKFCVKRSKNNFLENAIYDGKCKNGDKKCGSNNETAFCVGSNEQCPITRIVFDIEDFYNELELVQEKIQGSLYNLYVQRDQFDALPISQISASTGNGVCKYNLNNNYVRQSVKHPLYDVYNCDAYLDERWVGLKQRIPELDFFNANNLMDQTRDIPKFTQTYFAPGVNDFAIYDLYTRNYNQVQQKCRKEFVDHHNKYTLETTEDFLVMALVGACAFSFFLMFMNFPFLFKRTSPVVLKIVTALKFLFWAFGLVVSCLAFDAYESLNSFTSFMYKNQCLDAYNTDIFRSANELIYNDYFLIVVIFYVLFLVTDYTVLSLIIGLACKGSCTSLKAILDNTTDEEGPDSQDYTRKEKDEFDPNKIVIVDQK